MPLWLRVVAKGNPLSYQVDALQDLDDRGQQHAHSACELTFAMLFVVFAVMVAVATRLYPTIVT